jgi:hypothetical protein
VIIRLLSSRVSDHQVLERILPGHDWRHILEHIQDGTPAYHIQTQETVPQLMGLAWAFLLAQGRSGEESGLALLRRTAGKMTVVADQNQGSLKNTFSRVHALPGWRQSEPDPSEKRMHTIRQLKPKADLVLLSNEDDGTPKNPDSHTLVETAARFFHDTIEQSDLSRVERFRQVYDIPAVFCFRPEAPGAIPVDVFRERYIHSEQDRLGFRDLIDQCQEAKINWRGLVLNVQQMKKNSKMGVVVDSDMRTDFVNERLPVLSLYTQCRIIPGGRMYGRFLPCDGVFQYRPHEGAMANVYTRQLIEGPHFQPIGDSQPVQTECIGVALQAAAYAMKFLGLQPAR